MINLRLINDGQFQKAKSYWTAATVIKVIIFVLGLYTAFTPEVPLYTPQIIVILAFISEFLQLLSDNAKGLAESLLRTLDICGSFGRKLSEMQLREVVYSVPQRQRKAYSEESMIDGYFSSENTGARRAIENLLESCWYTGKQTIQMVYVYAGIVAAIVFASVVALVVASRSLNTADSREYVIRFSTAALMLVLSLNMIKSAISYYKMYTSCAKTKANCEHMLKGSEVSESDALKEWYEYQLARASCPLLPNWLWKLIGRSLDEAWKSSNVLVREEK